MTDLVTRRGPDLTAAELHDLLRLRVDVFVVEQNCPYGEIDGLDLLPTTWHIWAPGPVAGEGAAGCLRVLTGPDGVARVGRVVTAPSARGTGLGARLMEAAVEHLGDTESVLNAQTYAQGFYARFGYVPEGDEFDEDGIPHIAMRRRPAQT
ncbi:GNAT family N-acetyltransferase [Saccharomonospora sp. CUA-673]|uniref:GNAT family N-acetyltransferase n=1 Tax=Saccharomonospora sp. CUA-673 TaxID=1904969 RepID=UPI00095B870C|nr:GNAT family N-acetyltransferase [Saccharomonospora sp. CUA-673]OLT43649.1 GNAT family N-acetyltransferase [Saccharomonospora sp. CUA-673]